MNKLRVLLIDCTRPINQQVKQGVFNHHHPPVGLLALSSYVKRSDFSSKVELKILDSTVDYNSLLELEEKIRDFKPKIVGLRCLSWHTEQFHRILKLVKGLGSPPLTIAGGPYPSTAPQTIMSKDPLLDAVVQGQGEEIFLDVLKAVYNGNSIADVNGLYFRGENGTVGHSGGRLYCNNLDDLGFPNWEEVDFSRYEKFLSEASIMRKAAPIVTSRGCPYACIYCHKLFQKKFRARSAENVVQELELLSNLGVHDIQIIDDIFNLDRERVLRIFDLIAARNLKMRFYFPNGVRGDQMPNEVIDAMVDGGTVDIHYALESGSPRIQKLIKKNLNLDRLEKAISYTLDKKIMVDLLMMVGFPTETISEARQTLEFLYKFKDICFPYLNIVNVFPGTELFEWLENDNMASYSKQLQSYVGYSSMDNFTSSSEMREMITVIRKELMYNYICKKERLSKALEIQKRYLREDEIVAKYQSYFQSPNIDSIKAISALGIT